MPRPLRPIADGLIKRGNNRQPVFHGEGDFVTFLKAGRKGAEGAGSGVCDLDQAAGRWEFSVMPQRL
jgi:hypothetical protein